jgi:chromosome segregation protein
MFEEILGLRQLEMKKEFSEKKLENTVINLDKVNALVNEILPHFRSLKRYVSRFDKQQEYQDELIDLCKKYYGYRFRVFQKSNENIQIELKNYENNIQGIERQIEEEKSKLGLSDNVDKNVIGNLNQKQKEIEILVKDLSNQKQTLVYEMAKLEGQIEEKTFSIKRLLDNTNQPKTISSQVQKPRFISFENLELKFNNLKQLIKNILNSSDIYEIKSNIVSIEQSLNDILNVKEVENIKMESIDNTGKVDELKQNIEEIQNRINIFKNKIQEFDKKISEKDIEANQIEDQIEAESKQQREMFSIIEQKQRELMNLQSKKQTFNIEFEKNNINIENLKNQVSSMNLDFNFIVNNLDSDLVLTDSDLKTFYDKIEKLRAILNELGFVDQNIVDEYNDTQKRIEFLETQKSDLEKAVSDLKLIIKELAQKINDTFRNAIKEINTDFNKYLEMIFGGGKGNLEIIEIKERIIKTEEKEEQETLPDENNEEKKLGLEIKVKLPKTKLDGVEALSGGEKSLVSIALLFAIVSQSKPPLLVLDEVDAALDEENTRKFSSILKDLSGETQYIVITHNWLTMSSASVIYGVTIGKEKFSQIISLELESSRDFMKN